MDVKKLAPMIPTISPTREAGATGLRRGGFWSLPEEEFLSQLRGTKGRNLLYEISVNSPVAAAMLHAIRSLMRRAPYEFEAAGDKPRYMDAKEFAEENFRKGSASIESIVDMASWMIVFGFALQEIILQRDLSTGRMKIAKIAPRGARSLSGWIWDEDRDEPIGFTQEPWSGPQRTVSLSRCMHFRTSRKDTDDPEGVSLLRGAYIPYYYSKRLMEIEGIGTERDLSGMPILRIPGEMLDPNATDAQKAALATYQKLIQDVRRDHIEGVLLPSDRDESGNPYFEMALMSVAGNRQVNVGQAIERYEKRIAQSALAEFMFLGTSGGGTGSYALSSDKTRLFALSLTALLNEIARAVNEEALPYLWRFNGMNPDYLPRLCFGPVEPPALTEIADFVDKLTKAGLSFADKDTQNTLRGAASLPKLEDDPELPPALELQREATRTAAETARQSAQQAPGASDSPPDDSEDDDTEPEE